MKGRQDGVLCENMTRNLRKKRSNSQTRLEPSRQLRSWELPITRCRNVVRSAGLTAAMPFVGSGIRRDAPLNENERRLMKENAGLRKANEILKDALGFFAKDRKK